MGHFNQRSVDSPGELRYMYATALLVKQMATEAFREWAYLETERLRAEAVNIDKQMAALGEKLASVQQQIREVERVLERFLMSQDAAHPGQTDFSDVEQNWHSEEETKDDFPKEKPDSTGITKSDVIIEFIRTTGSRGVTLQEAYRFAEGPPLYMKPDPVRNVLWHASRKQRRLIVRDGRYYVPDATSGPGK